MTQILIPIPDEISEIRDRYRDDEYYSNLFDGNSLIIKVSEKTKYTPTFTGTETKYVYGTKGITQSVGQKAYGFDLELFTGRKAQYDVLQAYRAFLYNDPTAPLNLTLMDYVEDEGDPEGFKVRTGRMTSLKKKQGMTRRIIDGVERKLYAGIALSFVERQRRFIGQ